MTNVSIKQLVTLSSAIPKKVKIDIDEGEPIRSLLFKLCNKFGEDIRKYIYKTQDMAKLRKNIWILVDGRNIIHLDGLNTKIHGGESIIICNNLKAFQIQVFQRRLSALKLKAQKNL